jgi:hypothetical protein
MLSSVLQGRCCSYSEYIINGNNFIFYPFDNLIKEDKWQIMRRKLLADVIKLFEQQGVSV